MAALRVDADGGFVEHEEAGLVQQSGSDVQPPLHPSRVLVDQVVTPVGQAHQLEAGVNALVATTPSQPVQAGEEAQVLAPREIGVQGDLLGDEANGCLGRGGLLVHREPGDPHLAPVSAQEPTDHGDRRGLPCSVGAEEAVALTRADVEADAVDRHPVPESLRESLAHEYGSGSALHCHPVPIIALLGGGRSLPLSA